MALDFAAGCVGGAAGVLAGHPLDTIKVRLQTNGDGRYRGLIHCATQMFKTEGKFAFYKGESAVLYFDPECQGMSSPLAGLAVINAIGFGVYGNALNMMENKSSIKSAISGLCQSVINSPMELTKLRVQVQVADSAHARYHSPFDCARQVVKAQGMGGLYRGFWLTLMRDCPAFGTYFASYEYMVRRLSLDGKPEHLQAWQLLLAGGMAGTFSWLVNYPTDVIKTRFQADGVDPKNAKYKSVMHCVRVTYGENGWRSFTRGLGSTLLRAFPTNAATFFAAEWTFRMYETYVDLKHVDRTGVQTVEDLTKSEQRPYYMSIHRRRKQPNPDEYAGAALYLFPLTDAGSTMVDPLMHGSRFY